MQWQALEQHLRRTPCNNHDTDWGFRAEDVIGNCFQLAHACFPGAQEMSCIYYSCQCEPLAYVMPGSSSALHLTIDMINNLAPEIFLLSEASDTLRGSHQILPKPDSKPTSSARVENSMFCAGSRLGGQQYFQGFCSLLGGAGAGVCAGCIISRPGCPFHHLQIPNCTPQASRGS